MLNLNQFIYSRERRRFGRQTLFSDRTQYMLSVHPSTKLRLQYILRSPVNRSTQLADQKAHTWMETENVVLGDHGMYHYEGGWPREVNLNDEEATVRHRKKVEREDTWGQMVPSIMHYSLDIGGQNSAVNIYEEFFEDVDEMDIRWPFEARPAFIFHDQLHEPKRRLSIVDWAPMTHSHFVAQHTTPKKLSQGKADRIFLNNFYIWEVINPLKPVVTMQNLDPVRCVAFCPKDENYIAGGDRTGKVHVWDTNEGAMPLRSTPLESAHREPMTTVCWVHSKSNTEFYTGSTDGSIKYWDLRDLNYPTMELLLDPESTDQQERERAHGVSVLEFEYTIPVRFIIASDFGHIFVGNRKGIVPSDILLSNFKIFAGPIRTVQRNPFFVKNFLITGDWVAKVWAEECKGAPNTLLIRKKQQITCGVWSGARCSLFITGDMAGELDFWDLLLHHRKPVYTFKFYSPISYLKMRADGELLAVAMENGDLHLFELDDSMKQIGPKDKMLMAALFEREQLRCKLLEARVDEVKLKRATMAADAEKAARDMVLDSLLDEDLDPENPEQFLQLIEQDAEFKEALTQFKDIVTKVTKRRQEREYIMERTEFEIDSASEEDAANQELAE